MGILRHFLFGITIFLLSLVFYSRSYAATLFIDPSSATIPPATLVDLHLYVDTEGAIVTSVEAKITYDPITLFIEDVRDGGFFSTFTHTKEKGSLIIAAGETHGTKMGKGLIGIVTLRGSQIGVSSVVIHCKSQTTLDRTNIFNSEFQDIVDCQRLSPSFISVSSDLTAATHAAAFISPIYTSPSPPVSIVLKRNPSYASDVKVIEERQNSTRRYLGSSFFPSHVIFLLGIIITISSTVVFVAIISSKKRHV